MCACVQLGDGCGMRLPSESLALCIVCQGFLTDAVHLVCKGGCGVKLCAGCWEGFALANSGRPRCPMCAGATYPDLTTRDCMLNGILEHCLRGCAFCSEQPLGDAAEMASHERVCPFRPVQCPHVACKRVLRHCDLEEHVRACARLSCGEEGLSAVRGVKFGCTFRGTPREVERHRAVCLHRDPRLQTHLREAMKCVHSHATDVLTAELLADAWSAA